MYNDNQWAGNSQKTMADGFEELVAISPKLPINRLKRGLKAIGRWATKTVNPSEPTTTDCDQEIAYPSNALGAESE